jgi:hypothetical protein
MISEIYTDSVALAKERKWVRSKEALSILESWLEIVGVVGK